MLTVRKLSLAQASTYYSKDNYYTEQQGEFYGKLKDKLGLNDLTHESFIQLLQGVNPSTGESLVASKNGKEAAVPAFDFTFSPSKSISIVYEAALAKGDTILAAAIQKAHDNAVNTALSHIEQEQIKARVQVKGKRQSVNTGSMVAAKFQHDINRALDPQLHTHSVIFNITKCEDGKYRALDASHLLKKNCPIIKNIGQFYREALREELQKAGFELRDTNKSESFYELKNVDDKLIEAFSSRNIAIKAKVEELKKEHPHLSKSQLSLRAFFNTRVAKKEVNRDEVRVKNVELMSQHVDINKLLSSLQPISKNEVQKDQELKQDELKKLISLVKSEITNKKHRTPLNVATKITTKIDNPISISILFKKIKTEEAKQQTEFKNMHEVLINSLQSTKLDTQKLFASLKQPDIKIKIEEAIENARGTTNNRDRFAASFSELSDKLERAKLSHYRDASNIITTTAERGVARAKLERDDVTNARTTGVNHKPVVVTIEDIRTAERAYAEQRARELQKQGVTR